LKEEDLKRLELFRSGCPKFSLNRMVFTVHELRDYFINCVICLRTALALEGIGVLTQFVKRSLNF